jgi:hypothetical protein
LKVEEQPKKYLYSRKGYRPKNSKGYFSLLPDSTLRDFSFLRMREVIHLNIPGYFKENGVWFYYWYIMLDDFKNVSCVYCINLRGVRLYIGTTSNLYERIKMHFMKSYNPNMSIEMRAYFKEITVSILHCERCLIMEKHYIQKYKPIYNLTHNG